MSDLQCAATLLIARHGEAENDAEPPSEAGGSLSVAGREQARALAARLRDHRVSMIYSSGQVAAVQTAEIVAAELGVLVRVRGDLREGSTGESVGRFRAELELVADLHRGETVLVVSHPGAIMTALPQPASNRPRDDSADPRPGPCDVVEVAIDADGYVVRSWPGSR